MSATIEVSNEDALVDDVIRITIKHLQKHQKVTVRAEVIEKGQAFAGTGCFVADDCGTVDLSAHPSISGTYTGRGPFPGVIDMFGMVGSCSEYRSALLASRGFASLALPYFLYDGLPNNLADVEFEYFMEAVDYMATHRHVDGNRLGAVGVSKGGEIALQMGYYSDKIKSVVSINGAPFLTIVPMLYKGEVIGKSIFDQFNYTETEEGIEARNSMECDIENYLPLWDRDVHVLLIGGTDDRSLKTKFLPNLFNCYPVNRKHLCELHVYAGAGHLIDPPHAPVPRSTTRYNRGIAGDEGIVRILWGGETVGHAHAQEDSWRHILRHFRKTLSASDASKDGKGSKL